MNADSRNPQAALMADESMIRTLAAQIEAIWPQELPLLARYALGRDSRVLDAGCGTGEFSCRMARQYPGCAIIGVDVIEASLAQARLLAAQHDVGVHFEHGDIYQLRFADDEFDLTACRHVLQAIPDAPAVIRELQRVTRPGGWIHLIAEDYAMLHMMSGPLDPDQFWQQGPINFAARTGTDARVGRRAWSYLHAAGLEEIRVDYAIVDTTRVRRETFARIIRAWRDGYVEELARHASKPVALMRRHFDEIIASILDPGHYAVWFVPILGARKPGSR